MLSFRAERSDDPESRGILSYDQKRILFLCTGNSCRSQMAEGWARHFHGDTLEVYSAGTTPFGVDPRAIQVMTESGVDISGQTSNHVDEYIALPFDLVVTVCDNAREACPAFPGEGRTVHHSFDDPPSLAQNAPNKDEALIPYRRVRDETRDYVLHLTAQL